MNSVRLRLVLWNLGVFALALILLSALLREQVQSKLIHQVDREMTNRARPFVNEGMLGPHDAPGRPFTERLEQYRQDERDRKPPRPMPPMDMESDSDADALRHPFEPPVYDRYGKNLLTGHDAPDPAALRDALESYQPVFSTIYLTSGSGKAYPFRVYTARQRGRPHGVASSVSGGAEITVFQTIEYLGPVEEEVAALGGTLVALIPVALLVVAVGAAFLTDRALRPVRSVTQAAAEIQATDLSRRLSVSGGDEFARLADTLNGMLGRLESAFEQQKRFVADASHELRTPLTVIKANSELALGLPNLGSEERESFAEIDRAADRTIRIVQDLLLLARSDSGQLPLNLERLFARELLSAVAAEGRRLFPTRKRVPVAEIRVDASPTLTLTGDRHHLTRLLLNLTENALRHTPSTGVVTLAATHGIPGEPAGVTLEVRDTGEGIAPEHLAHLGERFYRVDSARSRTGYPQARGGSGLGLAICRTIAEAHGGTLTIHSQVGKGTVVRVELPVR